MKLIAFFLAILTVAVSAQQECPPQKAVLSVIGKSYLVFLYGEHYQSLPIEGVQFHSEDGQYQIRVTVIRESYGEYSSGKNTAADVDCVSS